MKSIIFVHCLLLVNALALTSKKNHHLAIRPRQPRGALCMSLGNTYLETLEKQTKQSRRTEAVSKDEKVTESFLSASARNVAGPTTVPEPPTNTVQLSGDEEGKVEQYQTLVEKVQSFSEKVTEVEKRIDTTADHAMEIMRAELSGGKPTTATGRTTTPGPGSELANSAVAFEASNKSGNGVSTDKELEEDAYDEDMSEAQKLMKQVKEAGTAGIISYALWELGFWLLSVPVVLFGYVQFTGHLPDLSSKDDVSKLGAEAFAFVNVARFAVPLRIGLALSTTPWIQRNLLDRFFAEKAGSEKLKK